MNWPGILSILVAAIAFAVPACRASAPPLKPEDAYLSPERYLNRYFGLSMDIPRDLNLAPIPVPKFQGEQRWLLALRAGAKSHAVTVTITASAPPKNGKVASALRSEFEADYPGPGKAERVEIGGETFWRFFMPAKPETDSANIVEYGGIVRDYLITFRIATKVGSVPDGFTAMIESATFVPPAEIAAQRTADMVPYAGPALPELGQPTSAIAPLDPGTLSGRDYRNNFLGIGYRIPDDLQPQPVSQPGTVPARFQAWGGDTDPKTAEQIAQTCTRPLLVADDGKSHTDGHVSPAVMITAIDPLCLQGAHFPASPSDERSAQSLAEALAEQVRLGRPGSTMTAGLYRAGDHMFLKLSGRFYGTERASGLRIPNQLRMIATELDGYIVAWTFVAPDTATVDRLAGNPVRFYRSENNESAAAH